MALAQLAAVAGAGALEGLNLHILGPEAGIPLEQHWNSTNAVSAAALTALPSFEQSSGPGEDEEFEPASKRGRKGPNGAEHALRHQAAEQRRRARINERLEALRKLVPHDPRANTASFLEDVIKHILTLKDTNEKLEAALVAGHPQGATIAQLVQAAQQATPPPQQQQQPQRRQGRGGRGGGAAAVAAAPPPAPPQAPPQGASLVREQHSLQQLLSHAQQHHGQVGVVDGGVMRVASNGLGGATLTLATARNELDLSAPPPSQHMQQVQQVVLTQTGSAEQEMLLRSLMGSASNGATVQLVSAGTLRATASLGHGDPQGGGAASFQHLLSAAAANQLAAGGVHVVEETVNVLRLG